MLGSARSLVNLFGPSVQGQVVEGVVDLVLLFHASDVVESGQRKVDTVDILMELYGETFFVGGESAEVVCEDHLFAEHVFNGVVIFLQME